MVLALVLAVVVLLRPSAGRALRVAAFGLAAFVVGIGPVLLMPQHFGSAYVGLAAFGLALAVTAPLTALPKRGAEITALLAALLFVYV